MVSEQPEVTAFCDRRLFQFRIHIEIIIFCIICGIKKACQLRFIETSQTQIEIFCLQSFNLHFQKLLIPSGIHCHTVVCENVCFLLRFGQIVHEHTRHFVDALFFRRRDSAMTSDHIEIPVDNDGIDKTELPEGRTELIDLLYVVGTSIIHIGNQLMDIHQLHLSCCLAHRPHLHQKRPHSANFSKPPMESIYSRACSTISA